MVRMKHNFTPEQLIKYIYRETSVAETMAINEALSNNWELYELYEELKLSYQQLPKVKFNPSGSAIQNILAYSEQTAVETQH